MKVEYSIMLKRKGDPDLFFIKLETPVRNIHDFCTMIQQQVRKGKIPSDADIVSIAVSDFIEPKVDWSLAPTGTKAWAKDEDGKCHWFIGGGATTHDTREGGKWLCEAWVRTEPAPDFGFDCNWHESICHRPVKDEIDQLRGKRS